MKIEWNGEVVSVQPRFRLGRSFDQRHHEYLGYAIRIRGEFAGEPGLASLGLGRAAYEKHALQVGDTASGVAHPVADPRQEVVDYYKVSRLRVARGQARTHSPPPWHGVAPSIEAYRERGDRRLAARTYATEACSSCVWGALMPVEMIIDQWNPSERRYRTETFCYGPKSCARYKPGPTRKVPGRRGMTFEEEDWIDEEATAHRGADD